MTTLLDPQAYGSLTLLVSIGIFALPFTNPFLQAGMRFLPEAAAAGYKRQMHKITRRWVGRILIFSVILISIGGALFGGALDEPRFVGILVALLLMADTARVYETSLLNAARRQKPMMLWRLAEAWARPLGALVSVLLLGSGAWQALVGYVVACLTVNIIFRLTISLEGRGEDADTASEVDEATLARRIRRYAVPLIPAALLGRINGTGDRYIIAAMLSVADTGLFAAVYAITSRPFLALGAFLEALLRPRLYEASTHGRTRTVRRVLALWIGACFVLGGVMFVATLLFDTLIADILLGDRFHGTANLMPWIAGGYAVMIMAQALNRLLHAHFRTDRVLIVNLVTAVAGVASTVAGISFFGILGAAAAIPFYFGVQFLVALVFVLRLQPGGARSDAATRKADPAGTLDAPASETSPS